MNDTVVQTQNRLNTLAALVQLATFKHLPGPADVRMQTGERPILSLITDGHDDAIAWCDALETGWSLNEISDEIWSERHITWRGWSVQIHSHTES